MYLSLICEYSYLTTLALCSQTKEKDTLRSQSLCPEHNVRVWQSSVTDPQHLRLGVPMNRMQVHDVHYIFVLFETCVLWA